MSANYSYDTQDNIVYSEANGTLQSAEIINHLTALLGNIDIQSNFVEIVCVENMVDFVFCYSDAEIITGILKDLNEKGLKFFVFVASNSDRCNMINVMLSFFQHIRDENIPQAFLVENKTQAMELAKTKIQTDGVDLF